MDEMDDLAAALEERLNPPVPRVTFVLDWGAAGPPSKEAQADEGDDYEAIRESLERQFDDAEKEKP